MNEGIACKLDRRYDGVAAYVEALGASIHDKALDSKPVSGHHHKFDGKISLSKRPHGKDPNTCFRIHTDDATYDRFRIISMRTGRTVRELIDDAIFLYSVTFVGCDRESVPDGLASQRKTNGLFNGINPFGTGMQVPLRKVSNIEAQVKIEKATEKALPIIKERPVCPHDKFVIRNMEEGLGQFENLAKLF